MSDAALTSLSAVQRYLGLSAGADEDLLTDLAARASDGIRRYCGRDFALGDYAEYHDGDGGDTLLLAQRPVVEVFALSQDGTETTAEDYVLYPEAGMVRLKSGGFGLGARNVYAAYRAGYESIPGDVEQAAIQCTAALYQARGAGGRRVTSERVGDYAVTYDGGETDGDGLPPNLRAALEPYRVALARPVR
jgi:hypothetical protein